MAAHPWSVRSDRTRSRFGAPAASWVSTPSGVAATAVSCSAALPEAGTTVRAHEVTTGAASAVGEIRQTTPEALGVAFSPRLVTLEVKEPQKRAGGKKLGSVGELVEALMSEAQVI